MKAAPFANAKFRTMDQIADWLEETYPAKCVVKGISMEDAQWYGAQHDLAMRLASTIRRERPPEEEDGTNVFRL